ncbi:MAG TPA: hypothetical protein VHY22_07980 [Chthoniobacteraceae bacterium]|jgi:hypothetical protein|nr:hypothetical protein [Chthoniobacteraceae bacterium]
MPELPADFDLKLMPDWLKEPAGKNPYANYEGGDEDRRSRGRGDDWGGRGRDDRRGGARPGGGPGGGGRRDDRRSGSPGGRRPDAKRPGPGGARPDARQGARPGGERRRDDGDRRGNDYRGQDSRGPREQPPQVQPAEVTIEFFPDDGCAVSIARQVKSTHKAYSLFDLARMFLARPERHRLKIATKSVEHPLYQVGEDGPVSQDRTLTERSAFPLLRQKYYVEATEQREAPKGNFTNVARCRANGVLLGPTNYHGYQPALRKLYEERFSRRMSFPEFQREIEVVNDPALVERWKAQASSSTIFRLKPAEPEKADAPAAETPAEPAGPVPEAAAPETIAPEDAEAQPETPVAEAPAEAPAAAPEPDGPVFHSLAEVEQHFREHYLPGLIRTATSFHLSGEASRSIQDHGVAAAVRQAWEQERGFPGQMMHQLRQQFSKAGLHVFKHRKRMQYVSLIRPSPMEHGSLSPSVAEILEAIKKTEGCNRNSLAAAILGADEAAVDQARKSTLATDLRWLIETGRVIEFSDGRLELPVVPAKNEPAKAQPTPVAPAQTAPAQTTPVEEAPAPEAAPEAAAEAQPEAIAPEAKPAEPAVDVTEEIAAVSAPAPEPMPVTAETVTSPESPASEP